MSRLILILALILFAEANQIDNSCPAVPETKPSGNMFDLEYFAWATVFSPNKSVFSDLFAPDCANFTLNSTSNTLEMKKLHSDLSVSLPKKNEEATLYEKKIYLEEDWILIYYCSPYFASKPMESFLIGSTEIDVPQETVSKMVDFWMNFMDWSPDFEITYLNGPCGPQTIYRGDIMY